MSHTRLHRFTRTGRRLVVLGALTSLVLINAESADARVNPYHVVSSGQAEGAPTRILVLIDTSGTMSQVADGSSVCQFDECEDESSTGMSRIAAARYAMRQVVEATEGLAEFGFVGFQRGEVANPAPGTCGGNRFRWVDEAESTTNGGGTFGTDIHGYDGIWEICGDHEGFPYLRFDNARFGVSLPDDLVTAVSTPVGPVDNATFSNTYHETRSVQWFDKFYGVRFQPTSAQWTDSEGDYSEVNTVGETFYYWPYVDGFPGYTDFEGTSTDALGVNGETSLPTNPLELYGPFYVDVAPADLNPNYDGPTSEAEARQNLLNALQTMPEGGIDLTTDTGWQWDNSVGSTASAPLNSASIFSSTTLDNYMTWHANALDYMDEQCTNVAIIIISDGENGWAGAAANQAAFTRQASLYEDLGVSTYVIGFNSAVPANLNSLACAGSGACDTSGPGCSDPCNDPSPTDFETCEDSSDPTNNCAWDASDPDELVTAFSSIVAQILAIDVDSGQGAVMNTFGTAGDDEALSQTLFRAYTQAGTWEGEVERAYCTDLDENGDLETFCVQPDPEYDLPDEAIDLTFGGCSTQTRAWSASECLDAHAAGERLLYTHTTDHTLVQVQDASGDATAAFQTELDNLGLLTVGNETAEANAIAQFVSGVNAPGGHKLPGLANSSPVVVKRIPEYDSTIQPEVAIRDPHCGGRYYNQLDAGALPESLEVFSEYAYHNDQKLGAASDFEYQEAVLVGDDMGVLHAFQLDSGNELWGFIPRGALANLAAQAANGPQNMGQPLEVEDHLFGISTTVNHAWIHDPGVDDTPNTADDDWKHIAIFGLGAGGSSYDALGNPEQGAEYYALDISHMNPNSPEGPIEMLWTTEDTTPDHALDLKAAYDPLLGETWARPAITYWVPNEAIENPPEAYLIMGSGYAVDATVGQGRTLIRANALTGEIVETAQLPAVTHSVYESEFGALVDPAVGSHCISRFWAEAQESYIADPAGRLFRWDLGRTESHAADSGGPWSDNGDVAIPVDTTTPYFPACTGVGATCSVGATASNDVGDVFVYPPAVSSADRIDDFTAVANGDNPGGEDQFLLALVSGSTAETTIDGFETGLDFHSSIYLLVDDHQSDPTTGFNIPGDAPKSVAAGAAGTSFSSDATAGYFRVAVSDIERTRIITIDGTEVVNETRNFSRQTRPIRAPRIVVTGAADASGEIAQIIEGVEVYFVEFTLYEPPESGCNAAFTDGTDYYDDLGSTYVLRFRLTADNTSGFNLQSGSTDGGVDFGTGFDNGLVLESVDQLGTDVGDTGNSGPVSSLTKGNTPCQSEDSATGAESHSSFAVPVRSSTISGFSPVE